MGLGGRFLKERLNVFVKDFTLAVGKILEADKGGVKFRFGCNRNLLI